jgi:hypothetical protein
MKAKLTIASIKKTYKVELIKASYQNNKALALQAVDLEEGEPFCDLSVNLPGSGALPKNQCYFKTYSENEGFLEQLEKQKLIKRVGPSVATGYVEVPLVEVLF